MTSFAISEDRLREIAAPYGGIEALNRRRALHNQATARLSKEWADLLVQYPNHWVAMGPDGLLATALSAAALRSELRAADKDGDVFAIGMLNASSEVLIL